MRVRSSPQEVSDIIDIGMAHLPPGDSRERVELLGVRASWPFAFPELLAGEGLKPWTVREVWLPGGPTLGHYVDITATFPRKVAALRAHESQTGQMENLEEFLRGWLTRAAAQGGLPEGRLAEAFQVLNTA